MLLTSKNREEINIKYTNEKSYIDRTKENHDEYEDDLLQPFAALDLLGLPLPDCDGVGVGLYSEDMNEEELLHLKRLLKVAILNDHWQNWEGLNSYIHLKRLSCEAGQNLAGGGAGNLDDGEDVGEGGGDEIV